MLRGGHTRPKTTCFPLRCTASLHLPNPSHVKPECEGHAHYEIMYAGRIASSTQWRVVRDEELRAVGVLPRVCHCKQHRPIHLVTRQLVEPPSTDQRPTHLVLEVLISEFHAVNRFTASSSSISEITALSHEAGNNSVEC